MQRDRKGTCLAQQHKHELKHTIIHGNTHMAIASRAITYKHILLPLRFCQLPRSLAMNTSALSPTFLPKSLFARTPLNITCTFGLKVLVSVGTFHVLYFFVLKFFSRKTALVGW